jgi:hypothetical protein
VSARATAGPIARTPLAQLLHALNQPLTGLQCSMEVALASPRTPEQYVHGLREGLELTERMRLLVGAIREVVDVEEESGIDRISRHEVNKNEVDKNEVDKNEASQSEVNRNEVNRNGELQTAELQALLREVADDLQPVAEGKGVRIALGPFAGSLPPRTSLPRTMERRKLDSTIFRMLDSALSLAARGTELQIETGEFWLRMRWRGSRGVSVFSRPELGLLVAQAGWERSGAVWERERTEEFETVTVRLPNASLNLKPEDLPGNLPGELR